MNRRVIVSSLVALISFSHSYSDNISLLKPKMTALLAATIPDAITDTIARFNKEKAEGFAIDSMKNQFILYGPHGNGKTSLVQYVAEQTDSEMVTLLGSSIINTYQNSGADTIKKTFETVAQKLKDRKKSVVLRIDEIDKVISPENDTQKMVSDNAMTELWGSLDKFDTHPALLVYLTTNNLNKLPKGLRNRFTRGNIVYIPNPNHEQRKQHLQHHFVHTGKPVLHSHIIDSFHEQLSGYKPEVQGFLSEHLHVMQPLLYTLNSRIQTMNHLENNAQHKEAIQQCIQNITSKKNALQQNVLCDRLGNEKQVKEFVEEYTLLVQRFLVKAAEYCSKQVQKFSDAHLELLAKETEGMATRSLIALIRNIHERARKENKGTVTEEIIKQSLKECKQEVDEQDREERDTEKEKKTKKFHDKVDKLLKVGSILASRSNIIDCTVQGLGETTFERTNKKEQFNSEEHWELAQRLKIAYIRQINEFLNDHKLELDLQWLELPKTKK